MPKRIADVRFCTHPYHYERLKMREVKVASLSIGGESAICIQSMCNTNTLDVDKTVTQSQRMIEAGAAMVRATTQGKKEAAALGEIRNKVQKQYPHIPFVADVHFNAKVAFEAARQVEKVRINPGNFVDKRASFAKTEEDFEAGLKKIGEGLVPFLHHCKATDTSIRIGINHGSLSDRIMNRYGNSPEGMVASAMEFLEICREEDFHRVVLSMKSSNPQVMVQANRLLVERMLEAGMNYPLHLGVTEAGEGENGRIKSAVGMASLLVDGLGDTIRVSLTEDPEHEMPAARKIIQYSIQPADVGFGKDLEAWPFDPFCYERREARPVGKSENNEPVVIASKGSEGFTAADFCFTKNPEVPAPAPHRSFILPVELWMKHPRENSFPLFSNLQELATAPQYHPTHNFVQLTVVEASRLTQEIIRKVPGLTIIAAVLSESPVHELRALMARLKDAAIPVIYKISLPTNEREDMQIKAACETGPLLLDGMGDGLWLQNDEPEQQEFLTRTALGILQATRLRMSQPDYISCPGCGRTQFNLQKTLKVIQERTAHLKGLKIGVMGCIVNGPGEMADADYGYVGAGPGKISLYKKHDRIKHNIPEEDAVEELVKLIKAHGDWVEE